MVLTPTMENAAASALRESVADVFKNVIENPESEKRWKSLNKFLAEKSGNYHGYLSRKEQRLLVKALQDKLPSKLEDLCLTVLRCKIISYKDSVPILNLYLKNNPSSSSTVLKEKWILDESTLSLMFKQSLQSESSDMLVSVLSRGFSEARLAACLGDELNAEEAIDLIEKVSSLFSDAAHANVSSQCLRLFGSLLDSHGLQFVYDSSVHKKILDSMAVIADFAVLTDSFALFDTSVACKKDSEAHKKSLPAVQTITLPTRIRKW